MKIIPTSPIRTFELTVGVSGPLEGGLTDWPAMIQDAVMAALARKADEVKLPLAVVASWCDTDFYGVWHVYVTASEVIAAHKDVKQGFLI